MSPVCGKVHSLWSQFLMLSFLSMDVMQDLFWSLFHMATHAPQDDHLQDLSSHHSTLNEGDG